MKHTDLTKDVVAEWLSYCAESGNFVWLKGRKKGLVAGSYDGRGYRQISLFGRVMKAHRLAWLLTYGNWPTGFIDHINHKTDDNAIANLRDVSQSTNSQNQVRGMKNSTHGFLGVKLRKSGRYESRIFVSGRRIALGSFLKPEDAHQAYLVAKRNLHTGCTI